MSKRKVFRYYLPLDDEWHRLPAGRVVHVSGERLELVDRKIEVWIEHEEGFLLERQIELRVYGTGHSILEESEHVGSTVQGLLVWHVYQRNGE